MTPRTGVFGGAFDPPHLGHVALVESALDRFGFGHLLVVPAGRPPHKSVATPAEARVRLAELAFGDIDRVEISRVELAPGGSRYTVDTLRLFRESHELLTLLIGADQFSSFLDWRKPEQILELARVAVASRPGFDPESLQPILLELARPERIDFFSIPAFPLSSHEIRARAARGMPIGDAVPAAVAAEVERLGLYLPAPPDGSVRHG